MQQVPAGREREEMKKKLLWNMIEIQCRQLQAQKRINKTMELAAKTAQDGADNAWSAALSLGKRVNQQEESVRHMRQSMEAHARRLREVAFDLEEIEDLRLMVYMGFVTNMVLLFAVIYLLGE